MFDYFNKCGEILTIILTFFSITNILLLTIIFFNSITDIKKINCDYLFINLVMVIFTIILFIINLLYINEFKNNKYYKYYTYALSLVIGLIFYSTLILFVDNRYICQYIYEEFNLKDLFDYLLLLSGLIHIFDIIFMVRNVFKKTNNSLYTSI